MQRRQLLNHFRLGPLCLAFVLMVAFAGCRGAGGEGPVDISVPSNLATGGQPAGRVLFTLPSLQGATNTEFARGLQDHMDLLGAEVTIHDSQNDAIAQYVAMGEFVGGGGNVVVCRPVDPAGAAPHLQDAQANGARVVVLGYSYAAADAGMQWDEAEAGALLGEYCAGWTRQGYGRGRDIVVLEYERQGADDFFAGAQQALDSAGLNEPARWLVPHGQTPEEAAEELLQEHTGTRAFIVQDDALALALYRQLFEDGAAAPANPNGYCIVSLGGTEELTELLRQGGAMRAAVMLQPYQQGWQLAEIAAGVLDGEGEHTMLHPALTTYEDLQDDAQ